jgi:hypothetical protein
MGGVSPFEKLVTTHNTTRRHISEESDLHSRRHEKFSSHFQSELNERNVDGTGMNSVPSFPVV